MLITFIKISNNAMSNVKRKLFFYLEQLQITKRERKVISIISILVVVLFFIGKTLNHYLNTQTHNYTELATLFEEHNQAYLEEKQLEEDQLLFLHDDINQNNDKNVISAIENNSDERADNLESNESFDIININTATLNEFTKLYGVGAVTAQRIIDYRNKTGGFKSLDEIKKVKGIGDKTFEKIKPFIEL